MRTLLILYIRYESIVRVSLLVVKLAKGFEAASPSPIAARIPLADEVAATLRTQILDGDLAADSFIRIEDMAARLGTSPTPVREALMTLRVEGFVEQEPRRGFRVLPLSLADINDVFSVISFVSGEIAARATRRLERADVSKLEQIDAALAQASSHAIPDCDKQFHSYLYRVAGAPKLGAVMTFLNGYTPGAFMANSDWLEIAIDDHVAIREALSSGDADIARAAGLAHAEHARAQLLDYMRLTRPEIFTLAD